HSKADIPAPRSQGPLFVSLCSSMFLLQLRVVRVGGGFRGHRDECACAVYVCSAFLVDGHLADSLDWVVTHIVRHAQVLAHWRPPCQPWLSFRRKGST